MLSNHGSRFSSVDGVCSGTKESQMGLGGVDRIKHDENSCMRRSGNHTPSSKSFTINGAGSTLCKKSPHMNIIAKFLCNGTIIRKKDFWSWVWEDGKTGAGRQECAQQDKLSGTRGRRQE